MILLNVLFIFLFILAFIYLCMGIIAYTHTLKDSNADRWLAISPWWAAYSSIYDEIGRKLSHYGKIILVAEMVGFSIWMLCK